tara:strand:- start:140 stop:460 length:321 start_codon:yes stop_codon:yes gene_type:complete
MYKDDLGDPRDAFDPIDFDMRWEAMDEDYIEPIEPAVILDKDGRIDLEASLDRAIRSAFSRVQIQLDELEEETYSLLIRKRRAIKRRLNEIGESIGLENVMQLRYP